MQRYYSSLINRRTYLLRPAPHHFSEFGGGVGDWVLGSGFGRLRGFADNWAGFRESGQG